ncbi:hypothetical protein C4B68_01450 [Streptomyces dengpaensis]|uniref:Transposase for insertion sequence element IS21-like C-terminal domain-containing protein n=2 Tax=Streptomyces TaxID=1883 RepID=A0ABN5HU82_9ACTN|nr:MULTISPECIES: hypothetical protein [Streptomyces]AVH54702.1 hypothetical protein C4B68_01450 [Streptomyces dengpaensis]PIB04177.1 hypothetical protein B1C81_33945 [Streptomyces sp. HG99]
MITVKMRRYSVPVRFIDRKVTITLTCDGLVICDGRREIARRPRLAGRGADHLVLDHYLEALLTRPGALERSEALHQARAAGTFTAVHEAFWAAARKALGGTEGTRGDRGTGDRWGVRRKPGGRRRDRRGRRQGADRGQESA